MAALRSGAIRFQKDRVGLEVVTKLTQEVHSRASGWVQRQISGPDQPEPGQTAMKLKQGPQVRT